MQLNRKVFSLKAPPRLGVKVLVVIMFGSTTLVLVFLFLVPHKGVKGLLSTGSSSSTVFVEDPCTHPIYCRGGEGSILHVVQTSGIFNDSKTFVDKPLKFSIATILMKFRKLMKEHNNKPSNDLLSEFVEENFLDEGTELEDWDPRELDWKENPEFIDKIKDPEYRALGIDLHSRWKDLGRKIVDEVRKYPEKYSEIFMSHPFIVPGGRFREMYYWDTYWTILGLLVSEMPLTVKGMLENFIFLINEYGHILNGNRIYYINRSQPPLFLSMVEKYYEATHDQNFLRQNIYTMEKEFLFWERNRTVQVHRDGDSKNRTMFRYYVRIGTPRPESYKPDYREAQHFPNEESKMEFYSNMRSGAESGWDYSTKWFIKDKSNVGVLRDTKATQIVPVELNSYMCKNSRILATFYEVLGNREKAEHYRKKFEEIKEAIQAVMWNEDQGSWFDFDLINNKQRLYFYPSTLAPLWAECYSETKLKEKTKKVLKYLKENPALKYPGGVPTSDIKSGQQWDLSNAWPPLQEVMITGLENTGDQEAKDLALALAKKWVYNNWKTYMNSQKVIFEKYDVEKVGVPGRGGEYEVVEGFGWTNGVLLHLLDKYGDELNSDEVINASAPLPKFISAIISLTTLVLTRLLS